MNAQLVELLASVGPPRVSLGAVNREGCGAENQTMFMLKDGPFEIGFSDDTFNLLLYAAWQGRISRKGAEGRTHATGMVSYG